MRLVEQLNFDMLLSKMWDYMGLTRVYTKRRGEVYEAYTFDIPFSRAALTKSTSSVVDAAIR